MDESSLHQEITSVKIAATEYSVSFFENDNSLLYNDMQQAHSINQLLSHYHATRFCKLLSKG